jgi:hypothetical protein
VISQITTNSARPIPSPPEYQAQIARKTRKDFPTTIATPAARATVGGECNTAAPEESNRVSEKEPQKETELWKKLPRDVVCVNVVRVDVVCVNVVRVNVVRVNAVRVNAVRAATWKSGASAPRKAFGNKWASAPANR